MRCNKEVRKKGRKEGRKEGRKKGDRGQRRRFQRFLGMIINIRIICDDQENAIQNSWVSTKSNAVNDKKKKKMLKTIEKMKIDIEMSNGE